MRPLWSSLAFLISFTSVAAAQSGGAGQAGTIRVLSNAERAVVSLDGTDVGVAPLEIKQVRPGEHVVAVRAEGRGRREDRVTVEPGATAVLTLDLDEPAGAPAGTPAGGPADDAGDADPVEEDSPPPGAAVRGPAPSDAAGLAEPPAAVSRAAPSPAALVLERRGLTAFGARALPRGHTTVAFGAGYPYLLDSRVLVGATPRGAAYPIDAGVLFRTYGARWELGATGRITLLDAEPLSIGAFADLGGGSTYFDDSKRNYWFASGGVALSLTGLGAVTLTGRAFLNAWSDRHCPGEPGEGEPTDLCEDYRNDRLDAETRARVDDLVGDGNLFGRDSGVRAILSLAVELALSDVWSGWLLIEGAPRQGERAAYTDLFHGSMFDEDARSYARVGFTYKF